MEAFAVAAMEIAPNPAPKSASPVSGTAMARPLPAGGPPAPPQLPVTASMGVIVLSQATRHAMQFAEFYARADALMYEAKASGRNRLAYERLTVFTSAPPERGRDRLA